MTDWTPATEAEAAMRDALAADDQELYFRILSRVELLLPISSEAIAGRAPMGWGTWTAGNRTHVLAFTSSEAMHACLAEHAGSARNIPYHELAAAWPNLEWWLAVNPGLPVEGYLPAWFVSQLARGDARLPPRAGSRTERAETLGRTTPEPESGAASGGQGAVAVATESTAEAPPESAPSESAPPQGPPPPESAPPALAPPVPAPPATAPSPAEPETAAPPPMTPANSLEQELLETASSGNTDTLLSILLLAKVLLPVSDGADTTVRPGAEGFAWRTEQVDGQRCVVVFTSTERLAAHLADAVAVHDVRFVQLIRVWPDSSWSLAVNPGTPIAMVLPASQISALASSAAEFGLDDDAGVAADPGPATASPAASVDLPPALQKALAPSQLPWYLERGYDRVSGFVHRAAEVAHLRSPAQLVGGLGLDYEGSPFSADPPEIYVMRWPAYIPSLYRIPYGGRTEAAMEAMEGWVVERAPFRGNGFAPSDSGDVIAEFKVDSVRLPHGTQLWRLRADGTSQLVAMLDADGPTWTRVEER